MATEYHEQQEEPQSQLHFLCCSFSCASKSIYQGVLITDASLFALNFVLVFADLALSYPDSLRSIFKLLYLFWSLLFLLVGLGSLYQYCSYAEDVKRPSFYSKGMKYLLIRRAMIWVYVIMGILLFVAPMFILAIKEFIDHKARKADYSKIFASSLINILLLLVIVFGGWIQAGLFDSMEEAVTAIVDKVDHMEKLNQSVNSNN